MRDFVRPLGRLAASIHGVAIPGEINSLTADDTAAAARAEGYPASPASGVEEALAAIVNGASAPGRILICGSLYLAGRVLADNG